MMKRTVLVFLLVVAFALSGSATVQAAKKVLHIYTAFDTEEAKYYIEAFEKETGIDVEPGLSEQKGRALCYDSPLNHIS